MYTFVVAAPAGALEQAHDIVVKDTQAREYSNGGCSALQSMGTIFKTL